MDRTTRRRFLQTGAAGAAWNDTAWEHERFNMLLKEAPASPHSVDDRRTRSSPRQTVLAPSRVRTGHRRTRSRTGFTRRTRRRTVMVP